MHGWFFFNADDRLRFKSAATVSAAKIERIGTAALQPSAVVDKQVSTYLVYGSSQAVNGLKRKC